MWQIYNFFPTLLSLSSYNQHHNRLHCRLVVRQILVEHLCAKRSDANAAFRSAMLNDLPAAFDSESHDLAVLHHAIYNINEQQQKRRENEKFMRVFLCFKQLKTINKNLIYSFLNQDSQCKIVNIMLIESNPNSTLAFSNS